MDNECTIYYWELMPPIPLTGKHISMSLEYNNTYISYSPDTSRPHDHVNYHPDCFPELNKDKSTYGDCYKELKITNIDARAVYYWWKEMNPSVNYHRNILPIYSKPIYNELKEQGIDFGDDITFSGCMRAYSPVYNCANCVLDALKAGCEHNPIKKRILNSNIKKTKWALLQNRILFPSSVYEICKKLSESEEVFTRL